MGTFRKYSYVWVTAAMFLAALMGHWVLAWYAYIAEQQALHVPATVSGYLIEVGRDTLENWQSEFLQLIWQVAGLAYLLYVGSPQSKEGDERLEEKVDALLRHLAPEEAQSIIGAANNRHPKR